MAGEMSTKASVSKGLDTKLTYKKRSPEQALHTVSYMFIKITVLITPQMNQHLSCTVKNCT